METNCDDNQTVYCLSKQYDLDSIFYHSDDEDIYNAEENDPIPPTTILYIYMS